MLNLQQGEIVGTYGAKAVTTTATTLAITTRTWVKNNHATNILYIGNDSSVTAADGYPLNPGEEKLFGGSQTLHLIASGAATDVRYLELKS